jgi:ribosomal protein L7/L12
VTTFTNVTEGSSTKPASPERAFMKTVSILVGVAVVIGVFLALGRGSSPEIPENVTDGDIRRLVQNGKKIQAIKSYRALHGVGLKEAKEAVEAMM